MGPPPILDFSKPENVREYFKRIYIEYRYSCFEENDPEGCYRLATFLENVKSKYARAMRVYVKNCHELGHARSCVRLGMFHLNGWGGCSASVNKSRECFRRACDLGSLEGCHNLGFSYLRESKDEVDKGVEMLDYSCSKGTAHSCVVLSNFLLSQKEDSKLKNDKRSLDLACRACELKDLKGCYYWADLVERGVGGAVGGEDEARRIRKMAYEKYKPIYTTNDSSLYGR